MRRNFVLFCMSEICESIGVQRRLASHMLLTLCRCQRLQTFSKLDVRSVCDVYLSVCDVYLSLCDVYLSVYLCLSFFICLSAL